MGRDESGAIGTNPPRPGTNQRREAEQPVARQERSAAQKESPAKGTSSAGQKPSVVRDASAGRDSPRCPARQARARAHVQLAERKTAAEVSLAGRSVESR
jgi:hypothetical protein